MKPTNPIAESFDVTIPSVTADPTRTLSGFCEFASHSIELEKFHRHRLTSMFEDQTAPTSANLYPSIAAAAWYGFEAGKNYVISGRIDEMLTMQDEFNRNLAKVREKA